MSALPDDYAEYVLDLVIQIPSGRVSTYGALSDLAREHISRGSARTVGSVLARYGGGVPWWRVCAAGGRLVVHKSREQAELLRSENVPFTRFGRVDMAVAAWPSARD